MASPRVSVIVPCYNAARYLAEALASIAAQTVAADELIVVDDGSTDGSGDIAAACAPYAHRARQENRGISAARNRGLELARGEVIAFLDADDVWPATSLACRLAVLAEAPAAEACSGLVEQFISSDVPDERRPPLDPSAVPSGARVAGAMLVRRAAFDRVGGFNPAFRVGETIDWVARADAAGVLWRTVGAVVLRRRLHETNTTALHAGARGDYLRVLKASLDRRRASAPHPR
jgi:glycosyltransferase involved in cell wall biosynthesis